LWWHLEHSCHLAYKPSTLCKVEYLRSSIVYYI
jgi:hypothetical protein